MLTVNWANLAVAGVIILAYGIFMWRIWPVIKESAIIKKAQEIVYLMEEMFGAKTGDIKFEKAVEMLQAWLNARGWHLDVKVIADIVTAAVGALHAKQGIVPKAHAEQDTQKENAEAEQLVMDV